MEKLYEILEVQNGRYFAALFNYQGDLALVLCESNPLDYYESKYFVLVDVGKTGRRFNIIIRNMDIGDDDTTEDVLIGFVDENISLKSSNGIDIIGLRKHEESIILETRDVFLKLLEETAHAETFKELNTLEEACVCIYKAFE